MPPTDFLTIHRLCCDRHGTDIRRSYLTTQLRQNPHAAGLDISGGVVEDSSVPIGPLRANAVSSPPSLFPQVRLARMDVFFRSDADRHRKESVPCLSILSILLHRPLHRQLPRQTLHVMSNDSKAWRGPG